MESMARFGYIPNHEEANVVNDAAIAMRGEFCGSGSADATPGDPDIGEQPSIAVRSLIAVARSAARRTATAAHVLEWTALYLRHAAAARLGTCSDFSDECRAWVMNTVPDRYKKDHPNNIRCVDAWYAWVALERHDHLVNVIREMGGPAPTQRVRRQPVELDAGE